MRRRNATELVFVRENVMPLNRFVNHAPQPTRLMSVSIIIPESFQTQETVKDCDAV